MSSNQTVKRLTVNNSSCLFGSTIIGHDNKCGSLRVRTDATFNNDIYVARIKPTNPTAGLIIGNQGIYDGNLEMDCQNLINIGNTVVDTFTVKSEPHIDVHNILNMRPDAKLLFGQGIKMGTNTMTNNSSGTSIGKDSKSGDNSVSIGTNAGTTDGSENVNLGNSAGNMSSGLCNINIGQGSSVMDTISKSITLGCDALSCHEGAIVIGPGISGAPNMFHLNFPSGGSVVATTPSLPRPAYFTICVNGKLFQISGFTDGCYNPTLEPFSIMASGSPVTSQNPSDNGMQQQANFVDKYTGPVATNGGFIIEYSAPGESTETLISGDDCPTNWSEMIDTAYNTNAQVVGASIIARPYSTKAFTSSTIDANGKILASENWNLYRFNTDGTLDAGFGTGGILDLSIVGFLAPNTPYINEPPGWHQIVVAPSGSIFVVGSCNDIGAGIRRMVVRKITSAGVIDNTFGTSGSYIDSQSYFTGGYALTLTNNGYIIVAGFDGIHSSVATHLVVKLTPAGVRDVTFGASGYARLPYTNSDPEGELRGVGIQSNGKIVVGGYFTIGAGATFREGAGVARFNPNGTIDTSYGENSGWTMYSHTVLICYFHAALFHGDEMYVGGFHEVSGDGCISALIKFNSNGLRDLTWGTNGTVVFGVNSDESTIFSLKSTCDNGIMAAGIIGTGNILGSFIYKLTSTGILDTTWGTSGIFSLGTNSGFYSLDVYETGTNVEVYGAGYGPVGSGLNGTVYRLTVVQPPNVPVYAYDYNYVPGLRIYDFSNAVALGMSMYNVPYSLSHAINENPNPPPECPNGWLVKNTPILQWTDANNVNVIINPGGATIDVSWDPIVGVETYSVSITIVGVGSDSVTHYYGQTVSAPTTNVTLDTSASTGNPTSYWSSITSVTGRVVGYLTCDTSLQPAKRCLEYTTFGATGRTIETINYALSSNGSTATASATYPNTAFSPSRAIDGILENGTTQANYWLSPDGTSGVTLTVDFGSTRSIGRIKVVNTRNAGFFDRSTNAYRLGVSIDNVNYTIVQTGNLTEDDITTRVLTTFPETLARYIRFYMDTYFGAGGGLAEIEAFGNQLQITSTSGVISVGQLVTGAGIPGGTYITAQISGTPGGAGLYRLNQYPTSLVGPIPLTLSANWNV